MKKKMLVWMVALMLLALPAAWAETVAPLTVEELNGWTSDLVDRAIAEGLSVTQGEAGCEAAGTGYTLYLSSGDLSADSALTGAVLTVQSIEVEGLTGPRSTYVGQPVSEVLALYPNDNPHLSGTMASAVLYIGGQFPTPVATGLVTRQGQDITLIEHGLYYLAGDGVAFSGVQYTVARGAVTAIRYFTAPGVITLGEANDALLRLSSLQEQTEYFAYDTENPTPLAAEDLSIGGLYFFDLTPQAAIAALGEPSHEESVADTNGDTISTMQWDGVEIVFVYDAAGKLLRADHISATGSLEGPRGIRAGNAMAIVLSRFEHGDAGVPVDSALLYGDANSQEAPYGRLMVEGADAFAYYAVGMDGGQTVLMTLTFAQGMLAEISISYI